MLAGSGPRAGKVTLDIITAGAPASRTGRNPLAATLTTSSRGTSKTTGPSWLSASSPCPGKCLAAAATPARRSPSTKAPARTPASPGVAAKDRSPMAASAAPPSASTTGAKARSKPRSRKVVPRSAATSAISAIERCPRVRADGVEPRMGRSRETRPPSSSTLTRSPRGARWRRPSTSARTWAASTTLGPSMITPPTPRAETSAARGSSAVVASPMPTTSTAAARVSSGAGRQSSVARAGTEADGAALSFVESDEVPWSRSGSTGAPQTAPTSASTTNRRLRQ